MTSNLLLFSPCTTACHDSTLLSLSTLLRSSSTRGATATFAALPMISATTQVSKIRVDGLRTFYKVMLLAGSSDSSFRPFSTAPLQATIDIGKSPALALAPSTSPASALAPVLSPMSDFSILTTSPAPSLLTTTALTTTTTSSTPALPTTKSTTTSTPALPTSTSMTSATTPTTSTLTTTTLFSHTTTTSLLPASPSPSSRPLRYLAMTSLSSHARLAPVPSHFFSVPDRSDYSTLLDVLLLLQLRRSCALEFASPGGLWWLRKPRLFGAFPV